MTFAELRRVVPSNRLIQVGCCLHVVLVITSTSYARDSEKNQAIVRLAAVGVAVPPRYNPKDRAIVRLATVGVAVPPRYNSKCAHCDKEETAAAEKFQHCICNVRGAP
jgi:hypothetical protein